MSKSANHHLRFYLKRIMLWLSSISYAPIHCSSIVKDKEVMKLIFWENDTATAIRTVKQNTSKVVPHPFQTKMNQATMNVE